MVFNFTVANLNTCNKCLLAISHIPCTEGEKALDSERDKAAEHIGFWKLCTAAVHVETG